MRSRWRKHILALPAHGLLVVGLLGSLLRYTVRDQIPILAVLFYALPPLVVLVVLAVSLGICLLWRWRRRTVASGLLTFLALVTWIQTDFVRAAPIEAVESPLRVVLWNVCPLADQNAGSLAILQEANAQILLLVGSCGSSDTYEHLWQSFFPDYHVGVLGHQMVFFSRYPIFDTKVVTMGRRTHIAAYDLTTPFGTVSVLGVDIESNPLAWRKPFIDCIHDIARSKPHPVIVLGDFNTPHTSAHFDVLRRSFHHAAEESGTGLITTWPARCPVLALDHIWLSRHFTPIRATLRRTSHSDHAMVVADVSLDNARQPDLRRHSVDP